MTDEERYRDAFTRYWNTWIFYMRKVDKWYQSKDVDAGKFEPMLMNPPFDGIVEANMAADAELTRLRDIEQRAGDVIGITNQIRHNKTYAEVARAVSGWLLDPYAAQRAYEDEHDRIKMGRKK
jgi:hypothetical protein